MLLVDATIGGFRIWSPSGALDISYERGDFPEPFFRMLYGPAWWDARIDQPQERLDHLRGEDR